MRFMKGWLIAGVLAPLLGASPSVAQTSATTLPISVPASCQLSRPGRVITTLSELPGLRAELERLRLEVADVGEPFAPFDVYDKAHPLPHRQFIRAYVLGETMIAWYYHGGFASHVHVVELQWKRDVTERSPSWRITGHNLTGPPCLATQALLDGVGNFRIEDW